jgi:hypothetical protein
MVGLCLNISWKGNIPWKTMNEDSSLQYTILHLYETIAKQLIKRLYQGEIFKTSTKIGDQTFQMEHAVSLVNINDAEKVMIS